MIKNTYRLLKASLIFNFSYGMFAPVYAIYVQKIGGSILDVGIAFSIFSIISGVLIISIGSSKIFQSHLKQAIVGGYILYALAYFLFIFIASPMQLFFVQILTGIATGILEPSWDAVFSARQSEKELSHNWSLWTGGVGILAGISALIGGIIASYSFGVIFIIMSLSSLISALFASFTLRKEGLLEKIKELNIV